MKAVVNGVAVEGTVEEVWAFLQKHNAQGLNLKPVQPMPHWDGPWWGINPPHPYPPNGYGTATTPDYLKWPQTFCEN